MVLPPCRVRNPVDRESYVRNNVQQRLIVDDDLSSSMTDERRFKLCSSILVRKKSEANTRQNQKVQLLGNTIVVKLTLQELLAISLSGGIE